MTTPLLVLEDIRKNFGAIEALKGISFTAEPGQMIAIVGPTGAGKTTIINLLPRSASSSTASASTIRNIIISFSASGSAARWSMRAA